MNDIPLPLTLICNVTGKQVRWTNRKLIQKAIDKHGSLDAFLSAYVSKGAKKKQTIKSGMTLPRDGNVKPIKAIMNDGVKLAPRGLSTKHLTAEQYAAHYQHKVDALVAIGASASEINWMKQRLDRWRG